MGGSNEDAISGDEKRFQNGAFPQALGGGSQALVPNPRNLARASEMALPSCQSHLIPPADGESQDGPYSAGFLPLTNVPPCLVWTNFAPSEIATKGTSPRSLCGDCTASIRSQGVTRCAVRTRGDLGLSSSYRGLPPEFLPGRRCAPFSFIQLVPALSTVVHNVKLQTLRGSLGKETAPLVFGRPPFPP